jgi:hypothetical protein
MKALSIFIVVFLAYFASANQGNDKIEYTYTLWFGDDIYRKEFIHLNSEDGIKFIDSMNQAAAKDNAYKFEFQQFNIGKFITKIGGVSQDPDK